MGGSASPYQAEPEGADRNYYERQQAIMALRRQISGGNG